MGQAFPRGSGRKRLLGSVSQTPAQASRPTPPHACSPGPPSPCLPSQPSPSKTAFTNLIICLHAVLSLGQGPSSPLCTQSTKHIVGALKTIQ